jgi:hypothetical protein
MRDVIITEPFDDISGAINGFVAFIQYTIKVKQYG